MEIKLGKKAIENYLNGLSLIDCIPENENKDWIIIEPELNKIQVVLK